MSILNFAKKTATEEERAVIIDALHKAEPQLYELTGITWLGTTEDYAYGLYKFKYRPVNSIPEGAWDAEDKDTFAYVGEFQYGKEKPRYKDRKKSTFLRLIEVEGKHYLMFKGDPIVYDYSPYTETVQYMTNSGQKVVEVKHARIDFGSTVLTPEEYKALGW